jgi:XTP/dITP diphosphohydrolase
VQRLVLASNNSGKLRELERMLRDTGREVLPQSHFSTPEVEETGASFVENAILKARNAAVASGLPAIGDDSGLMVDALDGAPGVRSARYAGPDASDEENLAQLLLAMRGVPRHLRGARFVCLMVYLEHPLDPCPLVCEGDWHGSIAETPRGEDGFGYDPIFLVKGLRRTAAELDPVQKNALSHRATAMQALLARLGWH